MESQSVFFFLSLVALVFGPVAYAMARLAGPLMSALDGFVFVAIGDTVIDYVLKATAASAYASADELVTFFAVFHTSVGLIAFALQAGIAAKVLQSPQRKIRPAIPQPEPVTYELTA